MYKRFLSAAALVTFGIAPLAANESPFIGVVNLSTCLAESKSGKKEQENLESLRNQMASLIEGTEKELREISSKFEDTEYLDSLSPKAEEDLKIKYQTLQEDLSRYQNQFYQVLSHANYQMMQKVGTQISSASEKVAKQKKLDYVINKDACFYIHPDFDVTSQVISEMDKNFDLDARANKKLSDNGEEMQAVDDLTIEQAR